MIEIQDALTLLARIEHRGRIEESEKLTAWRAIKLLYRHGIPAETCQSIVGAISSLEVKYASGPTLGYYIMRVRWALFYADKGPDPRIKVGIQTPAPLECWNADPPKPL